MADEIDLNDTEEVDIEAAWKKLEGRIRAKSSEDANPSEDEDERPGSSNPSGRGPRRG